MTAETTEVPAPRDDGDRDPADRKRFTNRTHSTTPEPEARYVLACPPGVPLDLWRAYGDRYPGGPRRARENREEAEAHRALRRRSAASSWTGLAGGDPS